MNTRGIAAKILYQVIAKKQSLDAILPQACSKVATTKDQALIKEICFGTLRWYHRLDFIAGLILAKNTNKLDTLVKALLLIGLYQIIFLRTPDHAAISETVSAARILKKPWATTLINAVLREYLRRKNEILKSCEASLLAKYSHPSWLIEVLKKTWPNNWESILSNNNQYPPMHLRVNATLITREAYLQKLSAQNIQATPSSFNKSGITLSEPVEVKMLPGFNKGLVSVQDLAPQFTPELLQLAPKQRVLDAAAAPGGKAAHILESCPGLDELIALDINHERLTKVNQTLHRLDLTAKLICGDAANPQDWWDGKLFDRILLDTPCSATGVIRRHPDIKILRELLDIEKFQNKDLLLLEALWPLLKAGGILLYATCSVLAEENALVMERFLSKHQDAREIKINLPCGSATTHGWQLFPENSGTDGFYYAKLEKIC